MVSVTQFSCKKLVLSVGSFSFSVSRIFLTLFSFISTYLFRWQGNSSSLKNDCDHSDVISEEINQKASKCSFDLESMPEAKTEQPIDFADSEKDREEKKLEFSFRFKFPTFEEFSGTKKENKDLVDSELVSSTSISKYEFMSEKSYSGFIEEPEVLRFDVKRINVDSSCIVSLEEEGVDDDQICSDRILKQVPAEDVEVLNDENAVIGLCGETTEASQSTEEMGEPVKAEHKFLCDQEFSNELQFHSQNESVVSDSDSDSISFVHASLGMSPSIDSYSDDFLSDGDFGGEFEFDALMGISGEKYSCSEMTDLEKHGEPEDFDEEDRDILKELSKLNDADELKSQFLSEQDFHGDLDKARDDQFNGKDDKAMDGSYDSEKIASKESSESGDANKLETLWEHQELIEQLKMELRKVRATGLPTILEESESPKITEDLKPWKIDEKFQHEECMDELHKFYKSFRERMRKFDIFNYQKMYAMGFLRMKDPLQSSSSRKSSGPPLKSLLSQNFWHLKHKISASDPMVKFMQELQSDLEVVYVGQLCLSWEFLHWQYGKALELWDSDPRLIHQYNEVAGEFQQFQVLMQRFIEDEPFQGPRVQYYTKSRCVNRYILQVPVIREDKKDRRRGKGERAQHTITSDMLVEMMEESIRILWRLIQADKDSCSAMVKGHKTKPIQLQNPGDLELLTEVRKILHKKERKLKDVLRSGNCILKRFRKFREDNSDQVLYFFSQVDMKLVCRVLNMSKITTEQLLWCHSKLSKISFEDRKIQVEPSFLLFPC